VHVCVVITCATWLQLSAQKVPGICSANGKLAKAACLFFVDAGEEQMPGTWLTIGDLLRMPVCLGVRQARLCPV
jgi:hypothetical protein